MVLLYYHYDCGRWLAFFVCFVCWEEKVLNFWPVFAFCFLQDFKGNITTDYRGADDVFESVVEHVPGTNSKQIYIQLLDPGLLDTSVTYTIEVSFLT